MKVCGEPLGAGNERNDVALDGNILVCLLLFRLLKFCLLHIFASICSIVIKFRFTKVLYAFVEVLVYSFKEDLLNDVQIPKSKFLLFLEAFRYGT